MGSPVVDSCSSLRPGDGANARPEMLPYPEVPPEVLCWEDDGGPAPPDEAGQAETVTPPKPFHAASFYLLGPETWVRDHAGGLTLDAAAHFLIDGQSQSGRIRITLPPAHNRSIVAGHAGSGSDRPGIVPTGPVVVPAGTVPTGPIPGFDPHI